MALADLLDGNYRPYSNGYDNEQSAGGYAPIALPQVADSVHRQVQGDVQGAAERSANGYGGIPQTSTGPKRTGNAQQDWMSLVQGLPANTQSIAQAFPTFAEWYPGSSYEKADLKGPWGWADTIGNLDSGNGKWQWYQGTGQAAQKKLGVGAPGSQFTDPLTKQYEALLQQQTKLYQQQQVQMQAEAQRQQAVRAQTDEAVKRLLGYVDERVTKLGQPAYTNSEMEVFRTRALEPIERDRTAANDRALQNIGSRGFDPSSGIAQELLMQVNRGFDQDRSATQNELAYKQIEEQRSRDQEKQKLLQYAAEAPQAAARGDLSFVQLLNDAINQPGQNALATSSMLSDLPVQRTELALRALGQGGQPQSSLPGVLDLLRNAQTNRMTSQQQGSDFWRNIGMSFF